MSSSVAISTAARPFNGTLGSEIFIVGNKETIPQYELDALPTINQTTADVSTIPKEFSTRFQQDRVRGIDDISTYMTVLLAMISISKENFDGYYAGNLFNYKNYADVRIDVWSANSPTNPFQARHAIYGLQSAIYSMSIMEAWYECSITLLWSVNGSPISVGYIKILSWPPLSVEGRTGTLASANTTQGRISPANFTKPPNPSALLNNKHWDL